MTYFKRLKVYKANNVVVVDSDSMERDVENALYDFHRDGFGSIVFYVGGVS